MRTAGQIVFGSSRLEVKSVAVDSGERERCPALDTGIIMQYTDAGFWEGEVI